MQIEKDSMMYFGTKNCYLFDIEAKSGQLKFQYRGGLKVVDEVTLVNRNQVVLTGMNGSVMMIESF
jgi:hypothetical protein